MTLYRSYNLICTSAIVALAIGVCADSAYFIAAALVGFAMATGIALYAVLRGEK